MEMKKTKRAVTTLWPKLVYRKAVAVVEGSGLYEKWCSDSRLFAPVRGRKKKCDGTIVSTSLPNSKAVL